MLITFAGLPGTGKTTLSAAVAARLGATYLRIDAFEAGLLRAGFRENRTDLGGGGYVVAATVAQHCLTRGLTVVTDAVNPVQASRDVWQELAEETQAPLLYVEVTCSDPEMHRRRVEGRQCDTPELGPSPTWQQVLDRKYEVWDRPRLVVDNVGPIETRVAVILDAVLAAKASG